MLTLGTGWNRTDLALVILLMAATFLTYPIGFILEHPFFVDEAWVAVGSRAPLSDLAGVEFPTPTGWAALLKLSWPGEQGMRLLPLGFGVATVVAAYLLARDLGWASRLEARVVGALTAAAVMLSPWALIRQELKQYTADACLALVILWLASRAETSTDRKPMVALSVAAAVSSVFSWTSIFVSVAVFAALFALAVWRRDPVRIRRTMTASAIVAGGLGLVYLTLIDPNLWGPLGPYWEDFYLRGGPREILEEMWFRYREVTGPYPWPLSLAAIGAFLLGLTAMGRRRPATALAVLVLIVVMVVVGLLGRYPFLDQRTSHFLVIIGVAVAAVGLGWIAVRIAGRSQILGAITVAVIAIGLTLVSLPFLREPAIPDEDVRSQVRHVQANRVPGDVVVVNHVGHFGLAYYWKGGELEFIRPPDTQFQVRVTGDGPMFMTLPGIPGVLAEAMEAARSEGGTGRIWIVRSHVIDWEPQAWEDAFSQLGLDPRVIPVGSEPLLVVDLTEG